MTRCFVLASSVDGPFEVDASPREVEVQGVGYFKWKWISRS